MSKTTKKNTLTTTPDFNTVDGRYLTRTHRTVQFATKVTPEFNQTIRRLAHEQQCLLTEMLEKFMAAYFELEELKQVKENEEKEITKSSTKAKKVSKIKTKQK